MSGIARHWAIGTNGVGSLSISSVTPGEVTTFGVYVTDPSVNLFDPNNSSGGGGALLAEMETLTGVGTIIPQTDTKSSSFSGTYSFGAQEFNTLGRLGTEMDFLGQGSVTSLAFGSATGFINDPFGAFSSTTTSGHHFHRHGDC